MIEEAKKVAEKELESKKDFSIHHERKRPAGEERNTGRIKPNLTQVLYPESYIQNEEQNTDSLWIKTVK